MDYKLVAMPSSSIAGGAQGCIPFDARGMVKKVCTTTCLAVVHVHATPTHWDPGGQPLVSLQAWTAQVRDFTSCVRLQAGSQQKPWLVCGCCKAKHARQAIAAAAAQLP